MTEVMLPLESNLLLEALPSASREKLRPAIRIVEYQLNERIYDTGDAPDAIFPLDGIVSAVQELEDGTMIEVGMIGAEGLAGVSAVAGVGKSPHTGLTQGRGLFAVCGVRKLRELVDSDAAVRDVMLRWMHVSLAQMAQTAVCNRVHEVDLRLAHWLLLNHDRAGTDEISVTQEFLGLMLGARRATINEAMRKLTDSGSIEHRRKRVRILDRPLLERQSCQCYALVVEHYEAAFGFTPRAKGRATPVD
ncbi:MAG TPA: Crp/Fnr family transcriptional regulator [Thermoanaerobaculia bacterium]